VQYIGIVDYASIILWVLEQAELAAAAIATGSATAAGMGAGALGALGALVLGLTGPFAIAGVATVAVGAAIAGGAVVERGVKDASSAVDSLGEDFYKLILENEPFKSTKVEEITRSYRWAPFLPVQHDDSMLTVLLLLTKFRLRSIPIVDIDHGIVQNMISQSSVVRGFSQCKGRDWFDSLAGKSIQQLGLPVMAPDQVVSVDASKLVLEAFKLMKEKGIGGLPVVAGPDHHIVGSISVRDVRFLLLKSHLFARRSHLTVLEFMKTISEVEAQVGTTPPVTCEKTDLLGKVIETLASKNLYRIYVVDETTRLLGVITLRDIISCFVSEPPGFFDGYFGGAFKEAFEGSEGHFVSG
jgi:CBS domain-containing protein